MKFIVCAAKPIFFRDEETKQTVGVINGTVIERHSKLDFKDIEKGKRVCFIVEDKALFIGEERYHALVEGGWLVKFISKEMLKRNRDTNDNKKIINQLIDETTEEHINEIARLVK